MKIKTSHDLATWKQPLLQFWYISSQSFPIYTVITKLSVCRALRHCSLLLPCISYFILTTNQ